MAIIYSYPKQNSVYGSDIILINTCSVRDHAEIRVKNKLDNFWNIKKKNQQLTIGVLGCMAQRLGADLIHENPVVDFVLGPDNYNDLPGIIRIRLFFNLGDTHVRDTAASQHMEITDFRHDPAGLAENPRVNTDRPNRCVLIRGVWFCDIGPRP